MMKKTGLFLIFLFTCFSSIHTFAADSYLCASGSAERIIEVVYTTPGYPTPCEVSYLKAGVTETLWRAENQAGFCESKAKELADKLSGSGWSCSLSDK